MLVSLLVPQLPDLRLDSAQLEGQQIVVSITATSPTASCPVCAQVSDRVHSQYQRTVMDLPWASQVVQLRLHVRRFRLAWASCLLHYRENRFSSGAVCAAHECLL